MYHRGDPSCFELLAVFVLLVWRRKRDDISMTSTMAFPKNAVTTLSIVIYNRGDSLEGDMARALATLRGSKCNRYDWQATISRLRYILNFPLCQDFGFHHEAIKVAEIDDCSCHFYCPSIQLYPTVPGAPCFE